MRKITACVSAVLIAVLLLYGCRDYSADDFSYTGTELSIMAELSMQTDGYISAVWPDDLPESVPKPEEFESLSVTVRDSDWYTVSELTFTCDTGVFALWQAKIDSGFSRETGVDGSLSDADYTFYSDGSVILRVQTSVFGDTASVALAVTVPEPFPLWLCAFPHIETSATECIISVTGDGAAYYATVSYIGSQDFDSDTAEYLKALAAAGYDCDADSAILVTGDGTYSVWFNEKNEGIPEISYWFEKGE